MSQSGPKVFHYWKEDDKHKTKVTKPVVKSKNTDHKEQNESNKDIVKLDTPKLIGLTMPDEDVVTLDISHLTEPNRTIHNPIRRSTWNVNLLTETAQLPTRQTQHSIGYDLHADEDVELFPWTRSLVSTGVSSTIPIGHYGRIVPRSSLAWKHSIDVGARVIDHDYRGEIKVLLINMSSEPYLIKRGERIAQIILECIETHVVVKANTYRK